VLPADITQQVALAPGNTCASIEDKQLNWAGSTSGGWGQSWAQWPNGGKGGVVCTRTLYYSPTYAHWMTRNA
jgi:hypothetical protein